MHDHHGPQIEPPALPAEEPPPPPQAPDAARKVREAERRQLTVMFCDLVDFTVLSERLDPEELREVVHTYHQVSAEAIDPFEGQVAQHLGDGLLVYFGYPQAHEDDARRAVRAGLGIVVAIQQVPLLQHHNVQVRIGIHTGLVVVGEIGRGSKRQHLALGETPNLAARLQRLAAPDTVVMSGVTYHLSGEFFVCRSLGPAAVKGISVPVDVYQVLKESGVQSRFEATVSTGLTPLVGRDLEAGLLRERWAQAKGGEGQVVLLSGEAGIGKSRLVQALKEQVTAEGATRIEFRCLLYHQNSALYPIIMHLQRLFQFQREESPQAQLEKLQQRLVHYRFPQADTVPLLAALLSLPLPAGTSLLTLSPQKQKQKTQEALVAWLVEEAERQAVYCGWKDLHWADPSTLELLTLFLEQFPIPQLLAVLTFRPEFHPTLASPSAHYPAHASPLRPPTGQGYGRGNYRRQTLTTGSRPADCG